MAQAAGTVAGGRRTKKEASGTGGAEALRPASQVGRRSGMVMM